MGYNIHVYIVLFFKLFCNFEDFHNKLELEMSKYTYIIEILYS